MGWIEKTLHYQMFALVRSDQVIICAERRKKVGSMCRRQRGKEPAVVPSTRITGTKLSGFSRSILV